MASIKDLFANFVLNRVTKGEDIEAARRPVVYTSGMYVTEDTAMMSAAYYRGIIYLATQIAKLPWEVKDKDNRVIEDSVTRLLRLRTNPEMNSFMFRLLGMQTALHKGNFYAEIERDYKGAPVALWPIDNDSVEMLRDINGDLVYRIIGLSKNQPGQDVFLRPRDIFHLRNFHTKDGLVGQGLAAYAADTLGINLAADRTARGLFANGGMPSGIISVKGRLSPEAVERMRKSWDSGYSGQRVGRTAILDDEAKFSPVTMDPQLMQFLESRQFGVVEISRFLGVPPAKLMDLSAGLATDSEQASLDVITDTLDAWVINWEIEADVKLLNAQHSGRFTEMDLYSVTRADMKTRVEYYNKRMQTGSITPNEIRLREGQSPYPEGDRFYLATNNFTPMDRVDDVVDAQINKGGEKMNPGKLDDPSDNDAGGATDAAVKQAIVRYLEK